MADTIRRLSSRTPGRKVWGVALATLAVITSVGWALQDNTSNLANNAAVASAVETGKAFAAVTKEVTPAVVYVRATKQHMMTGNMSGFNGRPGQLPDELRRFFGDQMPDFDGPRGPRMQPMVGEGSGFLISPDGYILTNNHVVGGAQKLEVTLSDGRKLDARLVGTDDRTDVAIIKVEGKDFPVLPMGDSDAVDVGEWVLAVGSPFGLTGTVTSGIVSAKGRDGMGITDYESFIQTDAAINPGNSGGPLVNLHGEAIGINTAIVSRNGGYNGIGFAIPMNMAKQICEQLMEHGSVTRGYVGVMIQPLTPELAKSFGLDDVSGVLVGDVTEDGPAAAAGLQRGDVIVSLNGDPIKDITSFRNRVAMMKPETQIELKVVRDGQQKDFSLQIGTLPQTLTASRTPQVTTESSWGLSVQTLNEQLANQLGLDLTQGVVVTNVEPASAAAAAGIRPGMVITEVNRKPVSNAKEFNEAVKTGNDTDSLLLLVQAGGHTQYLVLRQGQ